MIPQPILEAAQQKLVQVTTEAIIAGRKTPFLFSFVLGDDAHGRYYFTSGHPPNAKPPSWFRHLEGVQVWRAEEKAGEWLDYTVFKLVKVKIKVAIEKNNGAFWIHGLYNEKYHVRNSSTLAGIEFWKGSWGTISGYEFEYLTHYLLAN